ncbi:cupin domain-containing protein [Bradyrhizobium sp. dw_411]|uniref:cupin domain-containing protein n=1 Tax=Bradyrhizobium sp. dw_411 TaxID=2720082 RepID=UPI001BD156DD|nr:cupin domain-containing protein [Bradyrhizobium sp. dw_411]
MVEISETLAGIPPREFDGTSIGESCFVRNAFEAASAPPRNRSSNYPEPFASRIAGRIKRPLGDLFGLKNFGVNLTELPPGTVSALHHAHSRQDEFIYVLEGEPTLFTDQGHVQLRPGMCAGFPAAGTAHHLVNATRSAVVILEVGDRSAGDKVVYPADDIQAVMGAGGKWQFTRKDGTRY